MMFLNRLLTERSLMDGRQIFNAVVNIAITKRFRKSHPGNKAGYGSEFRVVGDRMLPSLHHRPFQELFP